MRSLEVTSPALTCPWKTGTSSPSSLSTILTRSPHVSDNVRGQYIGKKTILILPHPSENDLTPCDGATQFFFIFVFFCKYLLFLLRFSLYFSSFFCIISYLLKSSFSFPLLFIFIFKLHRLIPPPPPPSGDGEGRDAGGEMHEKRFEKGARSHA